MGFVNTLHSILKHTDPVAAKFDVGYDLLKPKTPPAPPGVVNPNDAMNAAQGQTDAMRMRRGMLSNIYAGGNAASSAAPVTGKVTLGT